MCAHAAEVMRAGASLTRSPQLEVARPSLAFPKSRWPADSEVSANDGRLRLEKFAGCLPLRVSTSTLAVHALLPRRGFFPSDRAGGWALPKKG